MGTIQSGVDMVQWRWHLRGAAAWRRNFGYSAGGWRVDQHPRFVADTNGDGRGDIVGFGDAGVWVSLL